MTLNDPCLISSPTEQKMRRESPPDFNCYRAASDPFDLSTQLLFSQAILVIGYPRLLRRPPKNAQSHRILSWNREG